MSEKRFTLTDWHEVKDNGKIMKVQEVVACLNEQQATISYLEEANPRLQEQLGETLALVDEQQATIKQLKEENEQLRQELQKKQEEERLYANEIVKLNKEAKEVLNFKELGGDY